MTRRVVTSLSLYGVAVIENRLKRSVKKVKTTIIRSVADFFRFRPFGKQ